MEDYGNNSAYPTGSGGTEEDAPILAVVIKLRKKANSKPNEYQKESEGGPSSSSGQDTEPGL